jgi:hypothetical protein
MLDERGTIQLKQIDVKAARFRERFKPTGIFKRLYVLGHVIEQGMKNAATVPLVVGIRMEIAFEQIAFEAGVYQVADALISTL